MTEMIYYAFRWIRRYFDFGGKKCLQLKRQIKSNLEFSLLVLIEAGLNVWRHRQIRKYADIHMYEHNVCMVKQNQL